MDYSIMKNQGIREGFMGQKMVVVPRNIRETIKKNGLINKLYLTDIGYYPNAGNHFRHRKEGADEYILIYCLEGDGWIKLNQQTYRITPNSYFIIPAGTPHQYGSEEQNHWSIYWVHFTGTSAETLFRKYCQKQSGNNKNPAPCVVKLPFEEERITYFDGFISLLESGHGSEAIEYVNISLWQLLVSFIYHDYYSRIRHENSNTNIIDSATRYMQDHLGRSIRINELADHMNYSVSYLYYLFKRNTGYSPINYFNHLKIQEACKYLSFTDMSVKEISFSLGFQDPLYFSRLFKKRMNFSPTEYREKLGNQPEPS